MTTAEQIKSIESLKGAVLRDKFREVTGLETKSNNRPYLIKRVVHALQAKAAGVKPAAVESAPPAPKAEEKPAPTRKAATEKPKAPEPAGPAARTRDPRLPAPGTVLEREYDGKVVRVKVLEKGFEFRAKTYRSLSAIAREVTSTSWNGWLFFKIIPYAKRAKAA